MDVRGFGARDGRTTIIERRPTRVDRLILIVLAHACVGAISPASSAGAS